MAAKELNYKELKRDVLHDVESITGSLEDVPLYRSKYALIGQKRAENALRLGLAIKRRDYNIFVSGPKGAGKTTFAESYAKKQAEGEPAPPDLCYVYNFKEPKCPVMLTFQPGGGRAFRDDMTELVEFISIQFNNAFQSDGFEEQKNEILKRFQTARDGVIQKINDEAKNHDFGVKITNTGIYFMPVVDGEPLSEDQFEALSEDEKRSLNARSDEMQSRAAGVMHEIKEFEALTRKEIDELEYKTALMAVGRYFDDLFKKHGENEQVLEYLLQVKEEAIAGYSDFIEEEADDDNSLQNALPWLMKKPGEDPLSKYRVNLFVDNAEREAAPVIVSYNPTYANLCGEVEYDSEYGGLSTDYMKIKAGLIHSANGGYLILQEEDVLQNGLIWDMIKKTARTGELALEPSREFNTGIAIASVKPKPVKTDVKFIIIGSAQVYALLAELDADFHKFFKISAVFDEEMRYSADNVGGILAFIRAFAEKEKLPAFDNCAQAKVLEHFVRLAENKNKLSARFNLIQSLLIESGHWARLDGAEQVTERHVCQALDEAEYRADIYREKIDEMIDADMIMLDTTSAKRGQINGLSVICTEDCTFGRASRITATSYVGKAGVINIEKEAEMSGSVHNKGVEVISGYLGQMYAQDFPLSLSCRICFEQNYGGIDGDSASSAELFAILSSLSGLPITQEIAVTGSCNQHGDIQPIGGVTAKIEGFFELCAKRGLTGSQGVIIPVQNVTDLCLKDMVIDAVRAGTFHIYPISRVDEGLKILTGVSAGSKNEKGGYAAGSVHGKVMRKLKDFYQKSLEE